MGKFIVAGPDAVEFLQRLYPTDVSTIRPGRSRYALLLNERGHVIDDGMICRESEDRFVLTFTTGGAGNAEMWMRDWSRDLGPRDPPWTGPCPWPRSTSPARAPRSSWPGSD